VLTGFLLTGFAEKIQVPAEIVECIEPGVVCQLVFELGKTQNRQTADARITLPLKMFDEGMAPSLKLYAVSKDGIEQYLTAETTIARYSAVTFIITDYFNRHSGQTDLSFIVRQTISPALKVGLKPDAAVQLKIDTDEGPAYTLKEMMTPVWESLDVIWETALPVSIDGMPAEAVLLGEPSGEISVRNFALDRTYRNGIDFVLKGKTIQLVENSSIPFLTYKQLYPDSADAPPKTFPSWKGGYVAFTEGTFWNDRQLAVTYTCSGKWEGPIPQSGEGRLLKVKEALRNGSPLKVVLLGDSISTGASASGRVGNPPFVPGFGELLMRHLRSRSQSEITFVNLSLGGMVSAWGVSVAPFYAAPERPDLCLIGFGMNDGKSVSAAQYIGNIQKIMAAVRSGNPDTEFILIASMLPNENWRSLAPMNEYADALKKLESETVAVADVWSMHEYILKTKRYCDVTGNHVNHPNDFVVRIYAQIISTLLDR
jgi:lysophospholipase L1-like esterase